MNGHLADRMRDAVASGEFAKAQRLWSEYSCEIQKRIAAGTATVDMLSQTRQLIDWCTLRVKIHQAHAASQLNKLYLAGMYRCPPPKPQASVRACF